MKRNKLFTAIAAVALLGSTGAALVQPNTPVAQAAKKSKKKTAKYATVRIRRGAPAYKFVTKKGNIKKIVRKTKKGKKLSLVGGKTYAFWSFKYKKTTYYFVGNKNLMVRAKDAKRTNKVKIHSLQYLNQVAINKQKAKLKDWQDKVNAALPQSVAAKVNTNSIYYNISSDGKPVKADTEIKSGTPLTVLYKLEGIFQSADGTKSDGYVARTSDNKGIVINSSVVTLDNPSAKVLTQSEYDAAQNNAQSIVDAANKDLGNK